MTDRNMASMPQPITERIASIVAAVPGWTPPDQLLALHMLAVATAPIEGDVMEIGSWCGRSAAVLGHAVAATSSDHVWAVDLFPTKEDWLIDEAGHHYFTVDIEGHSIVGCEQPIWDEPFRRDVEPIYAQHDSIMDVFNATIAAEGLQRHVTPYRGTGAIFASSGKAPKIRLAFLDGDHSYSSVCQDIDAVEQLLAPGGWLSFDDAFTVYEGVDEAIRDRIIRSDKYDCQHQVARKFFVARRK